jgi:hypothetical protein
MTKPNCAAVSLNKVLNSAKKKYQGKIIPEAQRLNIMTMCWNKARHAIERDNLVFNVCGTHNNHKSCLVREKGKPMSDDPTLPGLTVQTDIIQARAAVDTAQAQNTVDMDINKEKDIVLITTPTIQEIFLLDEILDLDKITRRANTLYGQNWNTTDTTVSDDPQDPDDPAKAGNIYAGSMYLGRLVKKGTEFFVYFDRGDHNIMTNAEEFLQDQEAAPTPTEEDSKALTLQSEQGEGVYPNLGEVKVVCSGVFNLQEDTVQNTMNNIAERLIAKYGLERLVFITGLNSGAERLWARTARDHNIPFEVYTLGTFRNPDPKRAAVCRAASVVHTLERGQDLFTTMVNAADHHIIVAQGSVARLVNVAEVYQNSSATSRYAKALHTSEKVQKVCRIHGFDGAETWTQRHPAES